jgi:hypothetical protein
MSEQRGDELLDDWRYDVVNGDTKLGFVAWLEHRREAERGDLPPEVDFAARYWAGDWSEGDIGRRRPGWVCGEDDDPVFVWKGDDGPFLVVSFAPDGASQRLAELDRDGERFVMTMHDRTTGEEQVYVMEVDDYGVIIEISVPVESREEHEFEQGWDEDKGES